MPDAVTRSLRSGSSESDGAGRAAPNTQSLITLELVSKPVATANQDHSPLRCISAKSQQEEREKEEQKFLSFSSFSCWLNHDRSVTMRFAD